MSDKFSQGWNCDDDVADLDELEVEGFHIEQTGVDFESFDDLFDYLYKEERENRNEH